MSGASAKSSKTKRTRRRRTLNIEATLERYEARISRLPRSLLMELDGAYLSTYDVYSTVTHTDRGRICRGGKDEIAAARDELDDACAHFLSLLEAQTAHAPRLRPWLISRMPKTHSSCESIPRDMWGTRRPRVGGDGRDLWVRR